MPYILIILGAIFVLIASVKAVSVAYVNSTRFKIPGIAPSLRAETRAMFICYLIGFVLCGLGLYLIDIQNGS